MLQIDYYEGVYIDYQARNVLTDKDSKHTHLLFHYNISSLHLEGGALMSEHRDMLEGNEISPCLQFFSLLIFKCSYF